MPKPETTDKKEALRQANPTDIVGSVDTRGIASRYDSVAGVAPLLNFYPEGDERDLGVTEDGEYEIMAPTEPGDVETREAEAYRASLSAESVASVVGSSSHPYSKGHEEAKDPVVHDLLNPKEGGEALEKGPDPDAQPVSIQGEEDDRPARERAAADAGRAILEGNPQDILRAEGSGDDHTVSTGLDDPKTQSTPRGERDEAPEGTVIDVTSEASGPDGVVEGADAEESIEKAREERQEGEDGTVVDEDNAPAASTGEVTEGDAGDEPEAEEALPEGWENDWTNDQMYAFAQEHDIEGVNSNSKKAELIAALKEWQGR